VVAATAATAADLGVGLHRESDSVGLGWVDPSLQSHGGAVFYWDPAANNGASALHFVILLESGHPYVFCMALVRILVDGYSLLHDWTKLAEGHPRHSATARDALIQILTGYQDTIGTPITIFFDGGGAPVNTPKAHSTRQLEVLYSRNGQTADEMIERAAYRFQDYGEVLAVTNDNAERNLVIHMGGLAESCGNFVHTVEATLAGMADDVARHNRQERQRYRTSRNAPTHTRPARKP